MAKKPEVANFARLQNHLLQALENEYGVRILKPIDLEGIAYALQEIVGAYSKLPRQRTRKLTVKPVPVLIED